MTTIGSLGDLHPFIAIAQALLRRGQHVVLAVPEDHVGKVRAAGIEAVAVMPSFETIRQRMGLSEAEAVERIMTDQAYLMEQVLMPSVAGSVAALDALLVDADMLVGSVFVFAAPIAAEKHRLPFIDVVLQPMTLFSRHDPPRTPEFRMLVGYPTGPVGRRWNAFVYGIIRQVLRHRYAGRIDAVRTDNGLSSSSHAVLIDQGKQSVLTLCCYSPVFSPLPPDAPAHAQAVGFATFDSRSGVDEELDPELKNFLDAGSPPLIFTLGSFAVFAPGDFYVEAAKLTRRLGRRAVLLVGDQGDLRSDHAILACRYAPHSLLFSRASLIVHHGGAGTTGQALRAGKPQFVVPHMGDQYDNACRIERLGVGQVLPARIFTADAANAPLSALLESECILAKAHTVGALVAAENGAETAAMAIEEIAKRQTE